MKFRKIACPIVLSFCFAPFAGAMIASVNGVATHNTTATDYVSEIWNRTVYLSAGTGTYLGNFGGTRWVLTAAHVSSVSGTISTSAGKTISLGATGTPYASFTNADGTTADLKLFSVSVSDEDAEYLDALGNIEIFTGTLYTNTPLYCVGTGANLSIGSGISSGGRVKQWGEFYANGMLSELLDTSASGGGYSVAFGEIFSRSGKSIQCGAQDSGSGAFVKNGNDWEVAGVAIAVGGTEGASSVGYYESGSAICVTNFVHLSQYAEQIYAVIPEPSAFGFLAGIFALGLAGTRRRRK